MCPTRRLPASVIATCDGVVLYPPRFGMTTGVPFSTIATQEFVVPRSIPMTLSMSPSRLQETADALQQCQSARMLRVQPERRIELPLRVSRQIRGLVDRCERDAERRVLRLELDCLAGQLLGAVEVPARRDEHRRGPLEVDRVRRLAVGCLEPVAAGLLHVPEG